MISAAFLWPMPWMYWSAIRTRLLVGISRGNTGHGLLSCRRSLLGRLFLYLGQVFTNANTTPLSWLSRGPGIV